MDVERVSISWYPADRGRVERLAQLIMPKYAKQPTSRMIRMALEILEIVVAQNNGELPDDIRRALEGDDEQEA